MTYISPTSFLMFNRKEWSAFRNNIPLTLSQKEMLNLKRINNNLSMQEITEIYLPLSKLLNLHICSNLKQQKILARFFNTTETHYIPYIIGITGSVASGKSTTARILQALLSRWPEHHIVELVTTDGFLYPNQILKKNNLMQKKGFPQSYNIHNLIDFIIKIKSGTQLVTAPIYSHITYDIVHNVQQIIHSPNILILEGLNILQSHHAYNIRSSSIIFSDFVDFSIYVDAPEFLLREWYIHRFLKFCYTTFSYPDSYFYRYSQLPKKKLISIASIIWAQINSFNLQKNILPTKKHANLILHKGINHIINSILLKK